MSRVTGQSGPQRNLLLLLAVVVALAFMAVTTATRANATPSHFHLPFPCGETWTGTTYANHNSTFGGSTSLPVDFNHGNGDAWENGHPVLASAAGTVITSAYNGSGYGNYVIIDHGGGWKTLYAHLASRSVNAGQTVAGGQQIGGVGNTGLATGVHLHYEQAYNNTLQAVTFNGQPFAYGSAVTSANCPEPPPSTPTVSSRIAMVDGSDNLYAKDGLSGSWTLQAGSVKAVDIAYSSGRIFYVTTGGQAYSKDTLTSPSVIQFNGAVAVAISPDGERMMVANAGGTVYAKDGGGPWTQVAGPMAKAIDVGFNGRMMFVDGNDRAYTRDTLSSSTVLQFNDARQIALSPNTIRMMVSMADGRIWAKDDPGAWSAITGPMVKDMNIGHNGRMLIVDGTDDGYTIENPGSPQAVQLLDIRRLMLGATGIMLATNADGRLYAKDTGGWTEIGGPMIKYIAGAGTRMP